MLVLLQVLALTLLPSSSARLYGVGSDKCLRLLDLPSGASNLTSTKLGCITEKFTLLDTIDSVGTGHALDHHKGLLYITGTRNDSQTFVDAAIFDLHSGKATGFVTTPIYNTAQTIPFDEQHISLDFDAVSGKLIGCGASNPHPDPFSSGGYACVKFDPATGKTEASVPAWPASAKFVPGYPQGVSALTGDELLTLFVRPYGSGQVINQLDLKSFTYAGAPIDASQKNLMTMASHGDAVYALGGTQYDDDKQSKNSTLLNLTKSDPGPGKRDPYVFYKLNQADKKLEIVSRFERNSSCLSISNPGDNWHKVSAVSSDGSALIAKLTCQPADGSLFWAYGRISIPEGKLEALAKFTFDHWFLTSLVSWEAQKTEFLV